VKISFLFFSFWLFCTGCDKQTPQSYLDLLNSKDGGFCKTLERNGYKVSVYYRPIHYFLVREMMQDSLLIVSRELHERIIKEYDKAYYFALSIGPSDTVSQTSLAQKDIVYSSMGNFPKYSENLKSLLFDMERKVFIKTSKGDTLYSSSYILDRNWGLHKNNVFLFMFPKVSNGISIDFKLDSIVVKDFDINVGTFKIPLKQFSNKPFSFRLR
jgi:hypothetical protein